MLKEFKNFIMTGNVVEFAVAVIMAGAIGGVVNGFVNNIIMPIVGHFSGGMDFSQMKIVLDEATLDATGAVTSAENAIMWGSWVNTIVNLIIVGFAMFVIIKAYNKSKKPAAAAGPSDNDLLKEIRDSLKK
jgi:large conductance mechanosensitive channel